MTEVVRLVCFSYEKRLHFHESQLKREPLQVTATQKSPARLNKSVDEYTVRKKSKSNLLNCTSSLTLSLPRDSPLTSKIVWR